MRDAIGQVFALQVILAFVILINGYMAYSVNYARAFRIKNQIVDIIEQYEGPYNDEAITKINSIIDQMTYEVPTRLVNNFKSRYGNDSETGESSAEPVCQNGWCYIEHNVSVDEADGERNGKYYSVVTFVNIDIPVINNIIGLGDFLSVYGETRTIY